MTHRRSSFLLAALTFSLPLSADSWYLPGVAAVSGRNGTRFVSSVFVSNLSSTSASVQLGLVGADGRAPSPVRRPLPASGTLQLADALGELFGLSGTFGALTVTSEAPLAVRGTTSNVATPPGTYGLGLVPATPAQLLSAGETGRAVHLSQSSDAAAGSRTNVSVVFLAAPGAASVKVRDAAGKLVGETTVTSAAPSAWQGAVSDLVGSVAVPLGHVEVAVTEGRAIAWISVVDNVTGDGTLELATKAGMGETDLLVSGVARAPGLSGTSFTTRLRLLNLGTSPVDVTLEPIGLPGATSIVKSVAALGVVELEDVVGSSGFGLSSGAGAVRVRAASPFLAGAVTSTPGGGGRYGASLAPVTVADDMIGTGEGAVLPGLAPPGAAPGFRTNLALVAGAGGARGTLVLRDASGAEKGRTSVTLAAKEWRQLPLGDWFSLASVPEGSRAELVVAFGAADAYASVIDEATGDAVVVSRAVLPEAWKRSETVTLYGGAATAGSAAVAATVTIGGASGTILPLLGVNIGPVPAGTSTNPELTAPYQAIGVTSIRTHDYYGPLDMATLFPTPSADPANPASYDFAKSDEVWAAILAGGFAPYLRLGDSYTNGAGYPPARPRKPRSTETWVKAAVEVVRHYTDPFRWGKSRLRDLEIWNEPDNATFWDGTREEFYDLYAAAAKALKAAFPTTRVGGPGFTPGGALAPSGQAFTRGLLDAVKAQGTPLDFLSWHAYTNDPDAFASAAAFYRQELTSRGLTTTTMHVSEWNTSAERVSAAEATEVRLMSRGASILTQGFLAFQDGGVTAANLYRGPDPALEAPTFYGIFRADARPKRSALAFTLWTRLAAHATRRAVTLSGTGIVAMAGADDAGEVAVLVANRSAQATGYRLVRADGRTIASGTAYQVDDSTETITPLTFRGDTLPLPAWSVQLVILSP